MGRRSSGSALWLGACARLMLLVLGTALTLLSACDSLPALVGPDGRNVSDAVGDGEPVGVHPNDDFIVPPGGVSGSEAAQLAIIANPVFCCSPLTVEFMADVGDDRPVYGVDFAWDFGDGRKGRGPSLEHTFPFAGTYPVRLTATRDSGDVQETVYRVTVGSDKPVALPDDDPDGSSVDDEDDVKPDELLDPALKVLAHAGEDLESMAGDIVVLDGSRSKGSGVHDLRFRWTQVSGPQVSLSGSTVSVTSFVAPEPGDEEVVELRFELSVSEGVSIASDSVTVRILRRSDPLVVADAGPNQVVGGGSMVVLDGAMSRGTGSRTLTYTWTQIEGTSVALSTPTSVAASFVAPSSINRPLFLKFELTVTQGTVQAKDRVEIAVAPVFSMPPATEAQMLEWLSALPPLPKTHYSWPMPTTKLREFNEDILREYMRITGAISVWGEWVDQPTLNRAISIARQINEQGPQRPVSLGIVFRPWNRVFPVTAAPTYTGPEAAQEVNLFVTRLRTIRDWLEQANQAYHGAPIEVTAVILECERFTIKTESDRETEVWNTAVDQKHDVMYLAAKEAFPNARVEWYARGLSKLFTLNELGDSYSVPLYHVPDRVVTRTQFRRTYDVAVSKGVTEVTPWIALGSGYITFSEGGKVWSWEYDYDLIYSWHIGAEVNDPWYGDRPQQFAPWHSAKLVIFWPAPWDDNVPNWGRHFVAYVRGAFNNTEMPR